MVVGGGGRDSRKTKCKSCTAGVIADCVAVCCCPCAVVDILFLALFKVPWTLGRKWLQTKRKKRIAAGGQTQTHRIDNGIPRMGSVEHETLEFGSESVFGIPDGQILKLHNFSAEELVSLDLYPVAHFGFGSLSFTEIPSHSQCNPN